MKHKEIFKYSQVLAFALFERLFIKTLAENVILSCSIKVKNWLAVCLNELTNESNENVFKGHS